MTLRSSDEAYRQAGVDLKRAEAVVDLARSAAAKSGMPHMMSGIGGFSGAFELPPGYTQPVLLSACDGVGTKLKLAFMTGRHDTVGIDLVAMSVNDILVNGGQPLVFLDYFATGQIQPEVLEPVLAGIAEGCAQSGCALGGGETAELPGFYQDGEYDLAGFCVGVVEKAQMRPQISALTEGDVLIGLASSGLHSNGYSLVRKILLADQGLSLSEIYPELDAQKTLGEVLLTPTAIYVKPILNLLAQLPEAVKAMVHVTGGGFYDNIPRVLPPDMSVQLEGTAWPRPSVFPFLQSLGGLTDETMYHTFNCGIGFILVTPPEQSDSVLSHCKAAGLGAYAIGTLRQTPGIQEVQIS